MTTAVTSDRVPLFAVYDFAIAPITFDFFNFLLAAESERCALGLDFIHLVFVPGDKTTFFEGFGFDEAEKVWRVHNVLIPGAALLPSCTQLTLLADRDQAERLLAGAAHVFPPGYVVASPVGLYEKVELVAVWARGRSVASLVVPEPAKRRVADYLAARAGGRRAVTITLRQASYSTTRNSDIAAWTAFAAGLDPERYLPIFIPDTEALFAPPRPELAGFTVFGEAAANLMLRAALYEAAFVNLMKGVGAGEVCLLNQGARSLVFITVDPSLMDARKDTIEAGLGIEVGAQLPFVPPHHKFVWSADRTDIIAREFAAFESFVDGQIDVRQFNPPLPADPRAVARHLARSGKPVQAQEILEHLLAAGGDDREIQLTIASLENQRDLFARALERLQGVIARFGRSAAAEEMCADALAGLGRHHEAAELYEQVWTSADLDEAMRTRVAINLGWTLARLGRIGDAARYAEAVLAINPGDLVLLRFLGELLTANGDWVAAERYLKAESACLIAAIDAAWAAGTDGSELRVRLAALHNQMRNFSEAHALMRDLIAREPTRWDAHECIADALANLGNASGAMAHFEAAIMHSWSRKAGPLLKLGHLLAAAGHLPDAERNFRRVLHLAPDHIPALEALADVTMRQGRTQESLQLLVRARRLALQPNRI